MAQQLLGELKKQGLQISAHPKQPQQPRTKPMEVLCLGLSRTGTMSLYTALNRLGINSYHMMECGRDNANGSIKGWKEAIESKYLPNWTTTTAPLKTAKDFDRFLWRYQAVTDIPCVLFADELLKAYPDAKVILTTRDQDGWVRSIQNSIINILGWKIWPLVQAVDWEHAGHYIPLLRYTLDIWTDGQPDSVEKLREGYRAHNAHIRAVVPRERLLEYHVSHGWEPLCGFLGKEVPEEPMPKVNEGMFVAQLHEMLVTKDLLSGLFSWVKTLSPRVVAGVGWWVYGRIGSEV